MWGIILHGHSLDRSITISESTNLGIFMNVMDIMVMVIVVIIMTMVVSSKRTMGGTFTALAPSVRTACVLGTRPLMTTLISWAAAMEPGSAWTIAIMSRKAVSVSVAVAVVVAMKAITAMVTAVLLLRK